MPPYSVRTKKSFEKDLQKCPPEVAERILERLTALASNPFPVGVVKLKGHERAYRMRVGDYRVIYEVDTKQKVIQVSYARHRKDVYKLL